MKQTYSQQVVDAIADLRGVAATDLELRIQCGKNGRIVLGKLASGEQRDEIHEDRAKLILSSLQHPAIDGIDLLAYRCRVPMLEISDKKEILFRQERDGTISINALCQDEKIPPLVVPDSEPLNPVPTDLSDSDIVTAAQRVAQAAEELMNPLHQEVSMTTVAAIGDYQLNLDRDTLTISKDETILVQLIDGQIQPSSHATTTDIQVFEGWVRNAEGVWETQSVPLEEMPHFMAQTDGLEDAKQQIEQLPESSSKAFFKALFSNLSKQVVQSVQNTLDSDQFKSAQKVVVTGAKSAFQATKQGLESEQFRSFQKQTVDALQDGAEKAIETTGHKLEQAGQWLASRPEAIREHRAARCAYELFERGFARTQEQHYKLNGFKVELQGRNRFILKDSSNQEVLRFKAEKLLFGEPRITILSKTEAGITREQYQEIDQLRQEVEKIRGSQTAEVRHAEKSSAFAAAARMVAEFNETKDYSGRHYRIEIGQDSLTITSKDGRGIIYQQRGEQVHSRLEQQDFGRFSQAIKTIEQQQINSSQQHQVEIG
jgi:hypothetical protein